MKTKNPPKPPPLVEMDLAEVIKKYGPINGPISSERVSELLKRSEHMYLLCLVTGESGNLHGLSGHHFVNVMERYEATKPLPENLFIDEIYFHESGEVDGEGLRHP